MHTSTLARISVQGRHNRLIDTLRTTPSPSLLSESIIGRDFDVDVLDGAHHSQQIRVIDLCRSEDYEPVLVGSVSQIFDAGDQHLTLELRLPSHAADEMLAFFWNQVVCLSTISGRFSSVRDGMSFEDIIDWVRPPSPESAAFEKYSIVVQVRPTIAVVRTTPTHVFEVTYHSDSPPSSESSLSSSETMASDGVAPSPPLTRTIALGDLLAIQCRLRCSDFCRPPQNGKDIIVRVWTIDASYIENVV